MVIILKDESISELSTLIADKENPVPAGGSTAAATGLLGVSLLQLVISVSNNTLNNYSSELTEIKTNLLKQIDQDKEAYQINHDHNFNKSEELKKLIVIPLSIAHNSAQALKIANNIADKVKDTVVADYQVAQLNLESSIEGALAIVKSNYQFFSEDSAYLQQIKNQVESIKL
ncbi:cyclodeaminase/cyclohydrolase family protein [Halanaerobaculum tunisiense]